MTKTALITGASSGIGASLARELASRGYQLGLLARRADRLEALAAELRATYKVRVETAELDVCDLDSVPIVIKALGERLGGYQLIIANAGVAGIRKSGSGDLGTDLKIFQTNVFGAIATLDAATAHFKEHGGGQLVGISSVAAFFGIPGSGAYSASKAALSNYLDAMHKELGKYRIKVTAIHPGFVTTELAPDMEKYPFAAKPEKVAREIVNAIEKGTKSAVVPRYPWAALLPALRAVPSLTSKGF